MQISFPMFLREGISRNSASEVFLTFARCIRSGTVVLHASSPDMSPFEEIVNTIDFGLSRISLPLDGCFLKKPLRLNRGSELRSEDCHQGPTRLRDCIKIAHTLLGYSIGVQSLHGRSLAIRHLSRSPLIHQQNMHIDHNPF